MMDVCEFLKNKCPTTSGRNWSFEVSLLIWDSEKKTRFCNDLIDR